MALFGLIGNPVAHSRSPELFREWAREKGLKHDYRLFQLEGPEGLQPLLRMHPDIRGLNVTSPLKEEIAGLMDILSEEAAHCRAVNTVLVTRKGDSTLLEGHNTDGSGFLQAYGSMLRSGEGVLVLGTGGAARAVSRAMTTKGMDVILVSRRPGKGQVAYDALDARLLATHRIVVQATPLGMSGNITAMPPFPVKLLTAAHLVIDLVYSPEETSFMRMCSMRGAQTVNGLEMLRRQAWLSYELWMRAMSTH